MLRTKVDAQQTLWEAILPPELLRLPPGLEPVDRLLDDPVFFEPFVAFFHPTIGRPSIPMETYLRMMFLRFRYRLGFETLSAEVTDSLAGRRFCRIGITDAVPHHRRTVPPDPSPPLPSCPVQKRPETGAENDRRGRGRASRGHSEARHAERRPCLHRVFQVEVIRGGRYPMFIEDGCHPPAG